MLLFFRSKTLSMLQRRRWARWLSPWSCRTPPMRGTVAPSGHDRPTARPLDAIAPRLRQVPPCPSTSTERSRHAQSCAPGPGAPRGPACTFIHEKRVTDTDLLRIKSDLVIECLIWVLEMHYQGRNEIVFSKQVSTFGENSRITLDD
jgi:hypothetical protein